jgi:8-oxo-dGTP diphosphatase
VDSVVVKAWGLCRRGSELLVQYAHDESLFRLPGGTVEFGEQAHETLRRELLEEYGLPVEVGPLVTTWENIFTTEGRTSHELVLVHEMESDVPSEGLIHGEHPATIRLGWRTMMSLDQLPTAPRLLGTFASGAPQHLPPSPAV